MSNDSATLAKDSPASVQLFQRAHQKMVMLQRLDDQVQQLLAQRRSIQDELRGIQVQINEEFDRLLRAGSAPGRILADIAEDSRGLREAVGAEN
jgi:hypothetical protein